MGSWRRDRSMSQELADMVLVPDASTTSSSRSSALSGHGLRASAIRNFQLGVQLEQILLPTPTRQRKTKIICAIGPSCWSVEMLGPEIRTGFLKHHKPVQLSTEPKTTETVMATEPTAPEAATAAVVADQAVRRPGEAPIKKEFLKPVTECPHVIAKAEEQGARNGGSFKKRPIDAAADPAESLCRLVAAGGMCAFGDSCKFSHDVSDYMKRKEKDMGDECPVFKAFGFCRYGLACRFARAHCHQRDDGSWENRDDRPMDQRHVDPEMLHESNGLTEQTRAALRKNAYPFRSAEQRKNNKKHRQNKGGKQQSEPAAPAADADADADAQAEVNADADASAAAAAPPADADVNANADAETTNTTPLLPERKRVDFKRKIYIAPLTTVGNLPFRRLMKQLGADITCGEMAMATNLLKAQQSEWALLRRHKSEDVFGVQIAGAHGDQMARVCELLARETDVDFIDINMGCPIDLVCRAGAGSALMNRPTRLTEVISGALTGIELGTIGNEQRTNMPGLTVKLRTGWSDKSPLAHKLVPRIQRTRGAAIYMNASVVENYTLRAAHGVDAITVHGRSRLQRYTKTADWDYVFQCSDAQDETQTRVPFIGGGDVLSYEEFDEHLRNGKLDTCMIARGALIKPWLPTEIKERRHWDISASERFDLLKDFVRFGLEHWGSDQKGINRTRRYLLEWQSFLCRYVPVGLLEVLPLHINSRPPPYYGRNDLETLMASDQAVDWIKISEMLLGPVPDGFEFQPKHKANAYASTTTTMRS
ncbi:hypothetical protein P43SY_009124 [Pythium insidiosum]|uniref:tRNA-dihydrouridine(47) synthase [NAD(P)(+)] n=1 Tax=Pythium insidiosum TaxID=114742 RepID=A0AAD5M025_PYTIN|nr:hypothetical protein P43SY_009124 [Pythium insidiosum]